MSEDEKTATTVQFVGQTIHTLASVYTVLRTVWARCGKPKELISFSAVGECRLQLTTSFSEKWVRITAYTGNPTYVANHFGKLIGIKVEAVDDEQCTLVVDPVEYTFGEPEFLTDFQGLQDYTYCMLDFLKTS